MPAKVINTIEVEIALEKKEGVAVFQRQRTFINFEGPFGCLCNSNRLHDTRKSAAEPSESNF